MWLTGATVIDGTGGDPVDSRTIQVDDGRITAVAGNPSANGETVDCTGLTIVPGLIDAHVHLGLSSHIDDAVAYRISVAEQAADMFENCRRTRDAGFTTVRDTGGIDGGLAGVVASGKVPGPRILQCGPVLCQTAGHGYHGADWEPTAWWHQHEILGLRSTSLPGDGPDEVRKNAREAFGRGADFLKLCVTGGVVSRHDNLSDTQFTVEEIAAAVSEASARGTYVTVHAHNNAGIRNAVAAGVRCIEHGSLVDDDTADLLARHDIALVPTLSVVHILARDTTRAGLPESMRDRIGRMYDEMVKAIHAARRAGVRVGLGTDLIGPGQDRRGLELMLRSEVETPAAALEAATRINADILGIGDEVGTIEPGKRADLVAFAGNPLEDPRLFEDPDAVVLVVQEGRIVKDLR
ncbi:amidohydrolase family protein [Amycolatopsis endophytica]|uniref:Imidazolonepropionase-like amidohydrolase n=1 Tax=Amycolatopsis endophytica TaxID=860233 RepID=A0A853BBT7_9PSEU|nr:amidohydrolase family protein [Amycolatopsis endophytica]NYI92147.1 imidazolonepropionase-like amidohydrolase [Amycolatopsis endophytica]